MSRTSAIGQADVGTDFNAPTSQNRKDKHNEDRKESRKSTANELMIMYPQAIPVVLNKTPQISMLSSQFMPFKLKTKYMAQRDITVGRFMIEMRKDMHLDPCKSMFLFSNNMLLVTSSTMEEVYNRHKNAEDDILYIDCYEESVFG